MKGYIINFSAFLLCLLSVQAQSIQFEEYDLANGMHVILHQDNSAPVVTVSVMYHVGTKNEDPGRTGFAHFFEHLLFEGSENIKRGEWFQIVASNGGTNNANTSDDRTYYFEILPSNAVELGLWMESERLLHPVINQIGVDTQNEVVKEEKRLRIDNQPYASWYYEIKKQLFKDHPYKYSTNGIMEHLDAATLDEFKAFNKKYYVPNNAVLVVSGDLNKGTVKKQIEDYFGPIPRGAAVPKVSVKELPVTEQINATYYDPNISKPALILSYRTPSFKSRDNYVLNYISTYLTSGKSSKLRAKLLEENKRAINIAAYNIAKEDYGTFNFFSMPLSTVSLEELANDIDEELDKLKTELISEHDFLKLQNKNENAFLSANTDVASVANSLANYYLLYNDTNLINTYQDIYKSITREDIMRVAKKYFNKNQRVFLKYLPKKDSEK